METIKPQKLNLGDTIGIIAPSREIVEYERDIEVAAKCFEEMGFRIALGKNIRARYELSAGTAAQRLDDLHSMFVDKTIKAVFCALGGSSSNQLLANIDYSLIKENPKIFVGFSDITHLLLAFYSKTSLVNFYGPSIKDFAALTTEAKEFLISLLTDIHNPPSLPRKMEIIKSGAATGIMLGGNLFVINSLLDTPYKPDLDGKILFLEDIEDDASPDIEFELDRLRLAGTFNNISGLIIGNIARVKRARNRPLEEIILEFTRDKSYPIIKVDYFGHSINNFFAIPNGVSAYLNTEERCFKLLESPVQ
jgi:muramoyltetrapeptide carboxypeptidase